jgi:hypothetical protein
MIHYSCDRCGRKIDPSQEVRYEIKIAIEAVIEPAADSACESERDHLEEIHESLESLDFDAADPSTDLPQRQRYDLCTQCYRRYRSDPLGAEFALHVGFSAN